MRQSLSFGAAVGAAAFVGLSAVGASGQCRPDWHIGHLGDPGLTQSGRNGVVNNMVAFDDGSGPSLFVSGIFNDASGTQVMGVARWDGSRWHALGSGIAGRVTGLAAFDDGTGMALYVGGNFLEAGGVPAAGVAKWDGSQWSALGDGIAGEPPQRGAAFTMAVYDDGSGPALYVGGVFDYAGGRPAKNIAKWDGQEWHNVGDSEGSVNTFMVWDDGHGEALFAGGNMTFMGGETVSAIAKLQGLRWSGLGSGVSGGVERVNAIGVFDDGTGEYLFAGGSFQQAGAVAAENIARWDGNDWSAVPAGGVSLSGGHPLSIPVSVMMAYNDGVNGPGLYVGGALDNAGGQPVKQLARLGAGGWSDVGGGVTADIPTVSAMVVHDDGSGVGPALYIGGGFNMVGTQNAGSIARWGGCVDECYPDCNDDGVLDFFDFLCFQNAFLAQDPYADCNNDGVFDFFDFLCFQNEFLAGCP
jgi:trimeric autotransporter adhesin